MFLTFRGTSPHRNGAATRTGAMSFPFIFSAVAHFLVEAVRRPHGALEVDGLEILPALLEQRHQEVDCHVGVLADLLLGHLDVADGAAEAEDFLELEAHGRLDLGDLLDEVVAGGDGRRELARAVHAGADETRDLLDERLGRQEGVGGAAELLHQLLVLVELLQVLGVGGHKAGLLGEVLVDEIADDAHLELGPRNVRQATSR